MFKMQNKYTRYVCAAVIFMLVITFVVRWRLLQDNEGLGKWLYGEAVISVDEDSTSILRTESASATNGVATRPPQTIKAAGNVQCLPLSAESAISKFPERQASYAADAAQYASDLNDLMDEMLNRSEIPADYAETMVALFHDKSQGDVIRDFAVQHLGLYAETLNMRGKYDADSREAETLRVTLWDAA